MSTPLFSILIAHYNHGAFFKDCFRSILAQTYTHFEVVIVDDCSSDNSAVIIQQMIANDPRFSLVVNKQNYGCGYTKRRCAELAKGEICGFLDPDDVLVPAALEKMVLAHQRLPDTAIITSKYIKVDLQLNVLSFGLYGEKIPANHSYLTYGMGALTHFATFKNDCYRKTSGINPSFKRAVDQDLYYKLEEVGRHYFLDEYLYHYRINTQSISANENLHKARYWHFKAQCHAFNRRRQMKTAAQNYTPSQYRAFQFAFYLSNYRRLRNSSKTSGKLYFLCKAFQAQPIPFFHMLKSKAFYSLRQIIQRA